MAQTIPPVFGQRVRAARNASGISQGALAEAMRVRGFGNWRQTTVAKTEAADRPVLFVEAVALSQILRRGIEYFLFEGTALDSVIDHAKREIGSLNAALAESEMHYLALKNDLDLYECTAFLGTAISKYQNLGDGSALGNDVVRAFSRWGQMCLHALDGDLLDSIGIDREEIDALDRQALIRLAEAEQKETDKLSQDELFQESGERLIAIGDFLEGKEVGVDFVAALRDDDEWKNFMAGAVFVILQKRLRRSKLE
jgi:transcriptional regulator with XRE-family HTH domain